MTCLSYGGIGQISLQEWREWCVPSSPATGPGSGHVFISILKLSQSTETIHRVSFILSLPCSVPPNPRRMETLQILSEELCEFGLAQLVLWNPSGIGYDWSGWVAKLLLNQNLRRRELCKTYLVLVIGLTLWRSFHLSPVGS